MTLRKAFFWTHLCVGVAAGIFILSMCVTGAMLAFEPQIVDFAERGVRFVPLPDSGARRLSPETLLAKAQDAKPGKRPAMLSLRADPAASAMVGFGRDGALYLNPYTGEALGGGSEIHEFLHEVEDFHRWLGDGLRPVGKPITGAAAIAFLGLSLSGVYLWWPRKTTVKEAVAYKKGLKGKARDWNWHTVTGFWISLFLVVITSTGMVISYTWASNLVYRMAGTPPPPTQERRDAPPKPEPLNLSGIDALWARAESQSPGWRILTLRFAPKADAPLAFTIVESQARMDGFRSQLTLDRKTGEVMKWEPFESQSRGRQWRSWIVPLHTGRAWGWFGQTINLIAALGGAVLVWTGLALSWRRYRSWRKNSAPRKKQKHRTVPQEVDA